MAGYVLRRLAGALLMLLAVSLIVFLLLDVAPGDAAHTLAGDLASQEQLAAVRHELGLDQPLLVRYARFVEGVVLRGDLGASIVSGRPVAVLLAERFGATLKLALAALGLALAVGLLLGTLAAVRAGAIWIWR